MSRNIPSPPLLSICILLLAVFILLPGCSEDLSDTIFTAPPTTDLYGQEGLDSIYVEHTLATMRSQTDSLGIVVSSRMSDEDFNAQITATTYSGEEVELLTQASELVPDQWFVVGDLGEYESVNVRFWYEEDGEIYAERSEELIMSDFNAWRPAE